MKTAVRCRRGLFLIRWDSIRCVRSKPVYSIGRPLFDKATIHLKGGKTFTIVTHNNSRENKYVQKMVLNGKELNAPFFAHQDMIDGGTLN